MRHPLSTLALCLLPALACAAGAASPPTIAVASAQPAPPAPGGGLHLSIVDVQRAVMETRDGRRAQDELRQMFDKRQQDLDAKQAELARERDELERQASTLSRSAAEQRKAELQRKMTDLQSVFVDYQKDLQKRQNELTTPIVKRLMLVVSRAAEQDGYDVVLDKSAVPYSRRWLDLTERVVKAYDDGV
jgi:outer membrane protein